MSLVLLNERGTPEPSPDIQRRLRAIHPRLGLRFMEVAPSHWAVTLGWSENDPRRVRVQEGKVPIGEDVDIVGYLPMDASVEQAPAYLSKMFREYPSEHARALADRVAQFNVKEPLESAVQEAVAAVLDSSNPSAAPKSRSKRR